MSLRAYQNEAVTWLKPRHSGLLALPPGAGKTRVMANVIAETSPKRLLIVAPMVAAGSVLTAWQDELWRTTRAWGNPRVPKWGAGTAARRQKARHDNDGWLILNYEAFRNDIEYLLEDRWDMVIFDESHRLKNRQSQQFKAAKKLAKHTDRLFLVTGTPLLNRAEELWTSLHLMDPVRYKAFWTWAEQRFVINTPRYAGRLVREVGAPKSSEHEKILRNEIQERMFYRHKDDILPELPPVIETYHEVMLTPEERRANDTMEANFWMEIAGQVHITKGVGKQTRLRQLCSDWSVFGEKPGTKVKVAAEMVRDLDGEQCIVFCAFRETADAAASLIPDAVAYHGGVDMDRRGQLKEAFIAGEITTLVATIETLGEAADGLQVGCSNVIFIDRDWTPAKNEQAVGRLHRIGQKSSVNVQHIVAAGTVDDTVSHALRTKSDVIAAVIESHRGVTR